MVACTMNILKSHKNFKIANFSVEILAKTLVPIPYSKTLLTLTNSNGNLSWNILFILAPPDNSMVLISEPEPSMYFSKSTPNWVIILERKNMNIEVKNVKMGKNLEFYFFRSKFKILNSICNPNFYIEISYFDFQFKF